MPPHQSDNDASSSAFSRSTHARPRCSIRHGSFRRDHAPAVRWQRQQRRRNLTRSRWILRRHAGRPAACRQIVTRASQPRSPPAGWIDDPCSTTIHNRRLLCPRIRTDRTSRAMDRYDAPLAQPLPAPDAPAPLQMLCPNASPFHAPYNPQRRGIEHLFDAETKKGRIQASECLYPAPGFSTADGQPMQLSCGPHRAPADPASALPAMAPASPAAAAADPSRSPPRLHRSQAQHTPA